MLFLNPGQTTGYLDCRSKGCSLHWHTISDNIPPVQNHTINGMLHDTLSPDALQKQMRKKYQHDLTLMLMTLKHNKR